MEVDRAWGMPLLAAAGAPIPRFSVMDADGQRK